jgi:ribosomal protein S18 acetylase RimI-like enzyme
MLAIRRYDDADREAVRDLHRLAMRDVGAHRGEHAWDSDLDEIRAAYLDAGGEFLVGLREGRLVAMGAFRRAGPGRAEVKRMRVHPEFQGRGFGQAIWDALEARARQLGYEELHLETSVPQVAARGLYEKNGFREAGREMRGGFECVLYEKRLGPAAGPSRPGEG